MKNTKLKIMGIIGIRSGSKGVPDKNIKNLLGKPLVGWVLDSASTSKYIDRIVVSTDSEDYAKIVQSFGADVPCLRPFELATDNSPEFYYVKHMLEWLQENENYRPDIIVRMMATSPLQTTKDIDIAIEKLINDPSYDSSVIVSEARQHPEKALKIVKNNKGKERLVTYFSNSGSEVTPIARQTYEKAYFRANVIVSRTSVIFDTNSLTGDMVNFHIIPQEYAIDIDNNIDFSFAEFLMKNQ
jgi:CMP-N-acetylneuraminic acid synthetase